MFANKAEKSIRPLRQSQTSPRNRASEVWGSGSKICGLGTVVRVVGEASWVQIWRVEMADASLCLTES